MRVLINPATHNLNNRTYGKTYNIVSNMRADDIEVDLVVSSVREDVFLPNVHVNRLHANSRVEYYMRAFLQANRALRSGTYDIYHHMNLSYRWFNPLLVAGQQEDTPIVIGPAQAEHTLPDAELRMKLRWLTNEKLPERFVDGLARGIEGLLPALNSVRRSLFARTLSAADRVVVVNEETKDIYSAFVPEDRIEVVPLGVDLDFFTYSDDREPKKIVAVGYLTERKGFDVLLDAMSEVLAEDPESELHILGDGPLREELKSQAVMLGIDDAVTFHGRVSQPTVREYFQTARVFVHPSRSESFSPVRLEAMAAGCPIVATDIVGAGEMIRDGTDGFVVPAEEADSLGEAILRVLRDDRLAEQMGENARRRTEDKYDWRDIGSAYLEIYRSLAKNGT